MSHPPKSNKPPPIFHWICNSDCIIPFNLSSAAVNDSFRILKNELNSVNKSLMSVSSFVRSMSNEFNWNTILGHTISKSREKDGNVAPVIQHVRYLDYREKL